MSTRSRRFPAPLLGALLCACVSAPPVRVVSATDRRFPAKGSASEVEILRAEPVRPFVEIAVLSTEGAREQTVEEALASLRRYAALLGADALVLVVEGYRHEAVFHAAPSRAESYGLPGPLAAIRDEADPSTLRRPRVEARAIRYETP